MNTINLDGESDMSFENDSLALNQEEELDNKDIWHVLNLYFDEHGAFKNNPLKF
jgi:hypothetical protein